MNFALYRDGIRHTWKIFLIFVAVLTMYISITLDMYDPNSTNLFQDFSTAMPQITSSMGMSDMGTDLLSYVSSVLYGFILIVFPMVFSIITANSLVAKKVDDGSMAYLLSAPVSRLKVAFTQLLVLLTGIVLLIAYATGLGIAVSQALFPGDLDIQGFLKLNVGLLCLQLLIGSICFLSSCVFNLSRYSLAFGAGIPAIEYLVQMLANSGDKYANLKYATFYTLFSPQDIIANTNDAYLHVAILGVAAVAVFAAAIIVFVKKDVPV